MPHDSGVHEAKGSKPLPKPEEGASGQTKQQETGDGSNGLKVLKRGNKCVWDTSPPALIIPLIEEIAGDLVVSTIQLFRN